MLADSPITLTHLLIAAGVALIGTWVYSQLRRKRPPGGGDESRLTPAEKLERLAQTDGVRGDLESLMVEIERLTTRFNQQLDTRTAQLDRLLREADERIARLEHLKGSAPGNGSPPAERAGQPRRADPDDPLARAVYDLADKGVPPADIARRLNEHEGKVDLILALRSAG